MGAPRWNWISTLHGSTTLELDLAFSPPQGWPGVDPGGCGHTSCVPLSCVRGLMMIGGSAGHTASGRGNGPSPALRAPT
eukprot:2246193-Rhodomonas_salina.1